MSSAAIANFSVHKDYVRITPLSIDATPSVYNAIIIDRTGIKV